MSNISDLKPLRLPRSWVWTILALLVMLAGAPATTGCAGPSLVDIPCEVPLSASAFGSEWPFVASSLRLGSKPFGGNSYPVVTVGGKQYTSFGGFWQGFGMHPIQEVMRTTSGSTEASARALENFIDSARRKGVYSCP